MSEVVLKPGAVLDDVGTHGRPARKISAEGLAGHG